MFRRYQSGDVSLKMIAIALLLRCVVLANYGIVPYSLIHLAALLQAVLQWNTEPLRSGLVELRNKTVEMRNEQRSLVVPVQIFSK